MKRGLRGLEEQRVNVLKYAPNFYSELQAMGLHRLQPTPPVECLTQRRREAESAENARNLANTMNYASNLLEAKKSPPTAVFRLNKRSIRRRDSLAL